MASDLNMANMVGGDLSKIESKCVYFHFLAVFSRRMIFLNVKMADNHKFWEKIRKSLVKKSKLSGNCVEFTGSNINDDGYGIKKVTWPDGSTKHEKVHRVSYMLEHQLLRSEIPRIDANGDALHVSHLCHNKICMKPSHLVLESQLTNVSRCYCVSMQCCTGLHEPRCLLGEH